MHVLPVALVLVAVCLAFSMAAGDLCNETFSSQQQKFLQKTLRQEALGLKAGMMSAFAQPGQKWFNLSSKPVCFGARGDQFGVFRIKAEGFLSAVKLAHVSGSVTCDTGTGAKSRDEFNSKWGCAPTHPHMGETSLNTVITTASNDIIFPLRHHFAHSNLWYKMDQFDSNSNVLVFQRFKDPLYVTSGQQLRLWFGEDLKDVNEDDNGGQTCAHVFGFYL